MRGTVYLADDEWERLRAIAERMAPPGTDLGYSILGRIAVKALLADPLPEWVDRMLDELYAAA